MTNSHLGAGSRAASKFQARLSTAIKTSSRKQPAHRHYATHAGRSSGSATLQRDPVAQAESHTMEAVFPEALKTLREADPEVFGIIEDEKKRQWYARASMDVCRCSIARHLCCVARFD